MEFTFVLQRNDVKIVNICRRVVTRELVNVRDSNKMGRKIPGKKHRGVKDPLKQQAQRLSLLETKINAPPKDVQEQAVPKSLERLIRLKEAAKNGRVVKVRKRKKKDSLICIGRENMKRSHPKSRPEKVVPIFTQKPGESGNRFMYRVSKETHSFLSETAFEQKYNVQINRNPETGKISGLSKRPKTELEEIEMLKAKHKNIKKKKKKAEDGPKMTKVQKRKEKLRMKKEEEEQDEIDEFKVFQDQVEFGEVAHEPPQLKARPKKADTKTSQKPGKKDLLLNSLFSENNNINSDPTKVQTIKKTGKRKNLPVGERRQLEKQQSDVIAAYRRLKVQRSADIN
ncbi:hypothetical protein KM043_011980 [Ampulex compressa]|nr:hypothetical protein KM043_011980 [Ampulex compressa]